MTECLSLARLLEEATADRMLERASGAVEDLSKLLTLDGMRKLDDYHNGIFAFMAYHPAVHSAFAEYIRSGALSSDSGRAVLALFVVNQEARTPQALADSQPIPGVTVDYELDPSYRFIEKMLPLGSRRPLPGILLFPSLLDRSDSVYVPCDDLDNAAKISTRCQRVFLTAARVFTGSDRTAERFDELCEHLMRASIQYYRLGPRSMGEWLIQAYWVTRRHGKDIATAVQKISTLF
jgi:hypothetical protein